MKACHECGRDIRCGYRCTQCHRIQFPVMEAAHQSVAQAVREGRLTNLRLCWTACIDCGLRATQYDHRDYMQPLVVDPVCRKCNRLRGPAAPLVSRIAAIASYSQAAA